ncbi:MAG: transcription antitermination factor NusB [Chitinophagales bacterium]|nr:transcription antitermination factor NusB [Bacteroidota bacterium]
MITRRSVRIKAMQYLYAYETSNHLPTSHFISYLEKSILSVKEQYLYILLLLREVANFVESDAKIKASKYIKTDDDKNFNTKLLSNILVQFLNNDKEFESEIKKSNTKELINEDLVRRLYKNFTISNEYKTYLSNGVEFNLEEDKKLISFLLEQIILEDEVFESYVEEYFTNWIDDAEFVVDAVQEVILKSKTELKLHLEKESLQEKFKELTQFGIDLFSKVVNEKQTIDGLFLPKIKNWEADRLAIVDMVLIKMAIAEFLFFPSIPVKVSINEYLDIAKEYSTPKSKDFINGILDSILQDLKQQNKLEKAGRGLI